MESNSHFEVLLSLIGYNEKRSQSTQSYKAQYEPLVLNMLESGSENYFFEEDLLDRYRDKSIEQILQEYPDIQQGEIYHQNPRQGNKLCPVYYDIMIPLCVKPHHKFYDRFFAYLLRDLDLLKVDPCLEYQLEKYHENNLSLFSRFLHLIIRKYKVEILSEDTISTIHEWISLKERQVANRAATKDSLLEKRNRIVRHGEDKMTLLSQEQTVLLIYYLQSVNVFLRDEYLTDTDAGKAFALLTGYSCHTIRQGLAKFTKYQSKHNLMDLLRMLKQLVHRIESDMDSSVSE